MMKTNNHHLDASVCAIATVLIFSNYKTEMFGNAFDAPGPRSMIWYGLLLCVALVAYVLKVVNADSKGAHQRASDPTPALGKGPASAEEIVDLAPQGKEGGVRGFSLTVRIPVAKS